MSELHEVHGVHPGCAHRYILRLGESPLWECSGCEGQMRIEAWQELMAARSASLTGGTPRHVTDLARAEAERRSREECWCGDPEVFAAGAEWATRTLTGSVEEAYQRGHEDGYWSGKTTDMSPSQAAAFMAPYRSRCRGCVNRSEGDGEADQ